MWSLTLWTPENSKLEAAGIRMTKWLNEKRRSDSCAQQWLVFAEVLYFAHFSTSQISHCK